MHLKMLSAKCRLFCLGLNVLTHLWECMRYCVSFVSSILTYVLPFVIALLCCMQYYYLTILDIWLKYMFSCVFQGDVQMAASVLVILGEKIRSHVNEISQEQWLMSYIGEYPPREIFFHGDSLASKEKCTCVYSFWWLFLCSNFPANF